MVLAKISLFKTSFILLVSLLTKLAVFFASLIKGIASFIFSPSLCGSVSEISPTKSLPLSSTTQRCSFTALKESLTSSRAEIFFCRRAQSSLFLAVLILPARRSLITPSSSILAKFPRAARSLGSNSSPMPNASKTPLPIWYFIGS